MAACAPQTGGNEPDEGPLASSSGRVQEEGASVRQSVAIAILLTLGFLAAASAAVLVVFLRLPDWGAMQAESQAVPEVTVLTAATALTPRTVLDDAHIMAEQMPMDKAPEGYLSDMDAVRGRMVAVPVAEGQPITSRLFPAQGSGFELAGLLPPGMRAVSVSLPSYSGLDGLLYPGSVVDVLASFSLSARTDLGTAVSTTLLENVQVLAVENVALTSEHRADTDTGNTRRTDSRSLRVTLMVDGEQAEALQLATEYGHVSLAMRNPQDDGDAYRDATLLNEGQLARLADVVRARTRSEAMLAAAVEPEAEPEPEPAPEPVRPAPAPPSIEVDILRGTLTETRSFSGQR